MAQKSPFEFNIWEPEKEKEERHKHERETLAKEHLTPEQIKELEKKQENFIDAFSERFREMLKKEK